MASIPASQIVSVTPSVVSAGGSQLVLNGLFLTSGTRAPIGSVLSFSTASGVSSYFGPSSTEYAAASIYFNGYTNSTIKPGSLLVAQYPENAVAGWLRGGALSLTLTQLQALSGTLSLTVAGTVFTSSTITLTSATSFSNAATIIQAGFTSPTFSVTYDSIASAFVFTTTATGATATITVATGTLASSLLLTTATGAVTSQGAAATTPATFMASIIANTTNWVSFMTLFDPDNGSGNTQKQAFASWANGQSNRYAYIAWDTDITPTQSTAATTSLGYILNANNSSGTVPIYSVDYTIAAFVCGTIASINTSDTNGRITLAFKEGSGRSATCTSATAASNLLANGYNFYGSYATANDSFVFFYNGQISGEYNWIDSYINQIWMNNEFQLALMNLLVVVNSIPYNATGYALIRAACADVITAALDFGAIQTGVTLSAAQIAEVNNAAGTAIDTTLSTKGYYLQISDASASTRSARSTPPMTFWYMDGGSVQQINLASVEVQ